MKSAHSFWKLFLQALTLLKQLLLVHYTSMQTVLIMFCCLNDHLCNCCLQVLHFTKVWVKTESHNLFGKFRINHMKLEILLTDCWYIFIHRHGDLIRKQSPHFIILPDVTETRHKWCCHGNLHISRDRHTCWFMVKPMNH